VESRGDGSVCTIWHPAATAQIVATAAGKMLVEIDAADADEARRKFAARMTARTAGERPSSDN
jgi:hypothetical protein